MEADWKRFRKMVPDLRERYLAECNVRIAAVLGDPARCETDRFWDAFEVMERDAQTLRRCLDGHSKSTMVSYMLAMLKAGMLTKDDLGVFSEELRERILRVAGEI